MGKDRVRELILAPSVLSADFGRLGEQVAAVERAGARLVHLDVMDGHFVPNLTLGPPVVQAVDRITSLPLDVHLMIEEPDRYLEPFRQAGADWISVHVEAARHLHRTLARIRELGARPGVVLNPATPISLLADALPLVDYVLVMSVNPGFGGQRFIPSALGKIEALRAEIGRRGLPAVIEVDGGVDEGNAADLVRAGADILVAGNAVFGRGDPAENTRSLISRMREGLE